MRWYDDVWLNEGLATYYNYYPSESIGWPAVSTKCRGCCLKGGWKSLLEQKQWSGLCTLAELLVSVCNYFVITVQWYGNLVTMRWYDDVWLKEGFATFYEYNCYPSESIGWPGVSIQWNGSFLGHPSIFFRSFCAPWNRTVANVA